MLIIGGKCSLDKNHLIDRIQRGAHFLEFHTIAEDFINYKNKIFLKDVLNDYGATCYAVHAPMTNLERNICSLTDLNKQIQHNNNLLIKKSIDFASEISNYKRPIVVVHPSNEMISSNLFFDKRKLEDMDKIFLEQVYNLNEFLLRNYPHIVIALENFPCFTVNKDASTNFFIKATNLQLAKDVKKLNLKNIGLTLDICHAESMCRFYQMLGCKNAVNILDFVDEFLPKLELIHLNNLIDFGEIPQKHSTKFDINDTNDVKYLTNLLKYLKNYNYQNPITIEVLENDYNHALNYTKTLETVNYISKNFLI